MSDKPVRQLVELGVEMTTEWRELGHGQKGLWLDQKIGGDGYYLAFRITAHGRLDRCLVERALAETVNAHEALRLRIDANLPRQRISSDAPPPVTFSTATDEDAERMLDAHIASEFARPMPLGDAPLFSLHVLEAQTQSFLLWRFQHLIADTIGLTIAVLHWIDTYSALAQPGDETPIASSSPFPYYTREAQYIGSSKYENDLAYWKDRFRDPPAPLIETKRGERRPSCFAATQIFHIDRDRRERLEAIAKEIGSNLNNTLFALFLMTLCRRFGRDALVAGTVLHKRSGTTRLAVGMFAGAAASPVRFDLQASLAANCQIYAEMIARDFRHFRMPLDELIRQFDLAALGQERLFDVALSWMPAARAETPKLAGLDLTYEAIDLRETGPISFRASEIVGDDVVEIRIGVNLDFLDEGQAAHFSAQFDELLTAFETNHHQPLCAAPAVSAPERAALEAFAIGASQAFAIGRLEALVRAQAQRTPQALAVVDIDGAAFTYLHLLQRAEALAETLIAQGVEPGDAVGVRMPRSADGIIAILGVLMAGGVYLPLDPAYPEERLAFMVEDAGATVIIDDLGRFPETPSGTIAIPALDDAEDRAYIIYTSGTTGRPKGVAVSHRAAANLGFARTGAHEPLAHGDRSLASIPVGFDASIGQLVLPLLHGATIVVLPDLRDLSPTAFWEFLLNNRVTHASFVPSVLSSLLEAEPAKNLPLRHLLIGGEPLSGALLKKLSAVLPQTRLVNVYGPTEAGIEATYHLVEPDDYAAATVRIGRPLPNCRAVVLGDDLQPVGIGVEGMLHLGGAGLAEGYVGRPELTAERFVSDPERPGERLYATGDKARWRNDGTLDFLGRADDQVKVRGHRIELGEITAVLLEQAGVREAAVIARGSPDARLLAYIVPEEGDAAPDADPCTDKLADALAERLPAHMVPAAITAIEALPLTPNGKLDQRALPEPARLADDTREPPRGKTEQALAEIWADLLDTQDIARQDNFFQLGGNSLNAVALAERLRRAGYHAEVRTLFDTPTLAGLAARLVAADGTDTLDIPPNLIPKGARRITPDMLPLVTLNQAQIDAVAAAVPGGAPNIQDIYPLAPLQAGILVQHLKLENGLGDPYLTPLLLSFRTRGQLQRCIAAVQELVRRHDVLRTAFNWHEAEVPLQIVLHQAELPVERLKRRRGISAEAQLRAHHDPRTYRLDLTQAPLIRIAVLEDRANQRWLCSLLQHHLILDHVSLEIVVREMRVLAQADGDAPADTLLPPAQPYRNHIAALTLQAKDWQQDAADFFADMLADIDQPYLPYGLANTDVTAGAAQTARLRLGPDATHRLKAACQLAGTTPASLLHLAYGMLIARVANRPDAVFGTVLLGRSSAHADQVAGMFINTLPIRIAWRDRAIEHALEQIQADLSRLLACEHTPLTLALAQCRLPAQTPLFNALFNFRHSVEQQEAVWAGLSLLNFEEYTNYPLAFAVDDYGHDLEITAQVTGEPGAEQVLGAYAVLVADLVEALSDAPQTPLAQLNRLSTSELDALAAHASGPSQAFSIGRLEALVRAQAQRRPRALAVVDIDGAELSYRDLLQRAEALAETLVADGLVPGDSVGVRMPRSANGIIAILGVLMAGGVYLPLDPAYPEERLAFMADDAGVAVVIDDLGRFPSAPSGTIDLPALNDAEDRAYIIYTSGTSGRPKGVAVSHRAAANLAFARIAAHDPIGPGDRILAAISVGFDVSVGQLLLPLVSGAAIVVAPELRELTPADYWEFLRTRRVSHINSVPSVLGSVLDAAPKAGRGLALKRLMLGGEALTGAFAAKVTAALPDVELVNMYGPTEACIDATYHVATAQDHARPVLPIGRPLPNYRAVVLGDDLQPVGIGVEGMLHLGGAGLAEGYVGRPELTAERFVADPERPGERLYATGDKARWRSDGTLDFLGRADDQVKIRGHRVELGEITAVLLEQAGVREAAVIARGSPDARLLAYIVPEDGNAASDIDQLADALAERLPAHMVPAAITAIEALPLTPNGKLDQRALPEPARLADEAREPPRGETEQALAEIWADLLDTQDIARQDNFFQLGGNSLNALKMIGAVATRLDRRVPITGVFTEPTLAAIARAIEASEIGHPPRLVVPLQPQGRQTPLFCIHPAGGHVLCYLPLMHELGTDQPVHGVQAAGLNAGERMAATIEEAAADYISAIKAVRSDGPWQLLGMSSGGLLAFEMAHQLIDAGEQVDYLAMLDTSLPEFVRERDFTDELLMRAMSVELGVSELVGDDVDERTLEYLFALSESAGRLPPGMCFEDVQRIADVFKNSVRLHKAYRPKAIDTDVTFVRALRREEAGQRPPDWSAYVHGKLRIVDMDCTHNEVIAPQNAAELAAALKLKVFA